MYVPPLARKWSRAGLISLRPRAFPADDPFDWQCSTMAMHLLRKGIEADRALQDLVIRIAAKRDAAIKTWDLWPLSSTLCAHVAPVCTRPPTLSRRHAAHAFARPFRLSHRSNKVTPASRLYGGLIPVYAALKKADKQHAVITPNVVELGALEVKMALQQLELARRAVDRPEDRSVLEHARAADVVAYAKRKVVAMTVSTYKATVNAMRDVARRKVGPT